MFRRHAAAVVAALVLVTAPAHARGQLQTRQTQVNLPDGTRAGRLVLANTGDAPIAAQVRVYAWTQPDGEDQLDPSNGLIASPPIVEIPAGGEQLVRLVRPDPGPLAQERAYRVVVDELPGDPTATDGAAITVRMRFLIPAFVRAADPAPADLQCRLERTPSTPAALVCENHGGVAAQLGASTLADADGTANRITPGLLGYVLAGSQRRWALTPEQLHGVGVAARLEVRLNGQPAIIDLAAKR